MPVVFLCGQKDCGKTFFLNLLCKKEKIKGYDLDEEILKSTGKTDIRELYAILGETEFRKTEEKTFDNLMASLNGENAVIALGGGAVKLVEKANLYGKTVYLYQLPDILFSRMEQEGLPSFIRDKNSFIELFNFRNKIYTQSCTRIIDLFQTEEEVVCQTLSEMYSK